MLVDVESYRETEVQMIDTSVDLSEMELKVRAASMASARSRVRRFARRKTLSASEFYTIGEVEKLSPTVYRAVIAVGEGKDQNITERFIEELYA